MDGATLADLGTGGVLVAAGAIAATRARGRATGLLLIATGAAWLAGSAVGAFVFLYRGPLIHLLLAYPRLQVPGRARRVVVVAAYVTGAVEPLGASELTTAVLCAAAVVAAGARLAGAGGVERRAAGAALAAAVLVCTALGTAALARTAGADDAAVLAACELAIIIAGAGLAADVRFGRWTHGVIAGLMLDLGGLERAAPLAEEIGRAVGDPSLTIAYSRGDGYLDEAGRPVALPAPGDARRVVTPILEAGMPVAALIHDPATLADTALERAAVAATRTALENVRLDAEVAARVDELEASARRLVTAGDAERRRLARAVEEHAERRLAAVATMLAADAPALARATAQASDELARFAAGLRPSRLALAGLAAALDELAERANRPVVVRAPAGRFADVVEATMFFVCSEALANVTKHAGATAVRIEVEQRDGRLVAEIADDGIGGAEAARGSGLRGLADRLGALGGALTVVSPTGSGTLVRAELPIAP
jgi:signal transduction histidine kinase